MDADGVPYFYKYGKFSPICGHGFWNNANGGSSFCKALHPNSKTFTLSKEYSQGSYGQDAIMIGECNPGDAIKSCRGGSNSYSFNDNCKVGNNAKILITCDWRTQGSEWNSCPGKITCKSFMKGCEPNVCSIKNFILTLSNSIFLNLYFQSMIISSL